MAALNLVQQTGCTPLMFAAKEDSMHKKNKQLHICRMLLNYGVDRNFWDGDGLAALGTFWCSTHDVRYFRQMHKFAARFTDYDENYFYEMEVRE